MNGMWTCCQVCKNYTTIALYPKGVKVPKNKLKIVLAQVRHPLLNISVSVQIERSSVGFVFKTYFVNLFNQMTLARSWSDLVGFSPFRIGLLFVTRKTLGLIKPIKI